MRELSVQNLLAFCLNDACRHQALIDVSNYSVETEVPSFQRCAKGRAKLTHSGSWSEAVPDGLSGYRNLWIISCRAPRRGLSLHLRRALLRE